MALPARWKNPAYKESKCGNSYHSHDAQENECAIQANFFSPCDCVPPAAGIVYRARFVVQAAVKPGQYAMLMQNAIAKTIQKPCEANAGLEIRIYFSVSDFSFWFHTFRGFSSRRSVGQGGSLEPELKLMGAVNGPLKQTQTLPAILPDNRNSLLSGGHRVCRWLITSLDVSTHF